MTSHRSLSADVPRPTQLGDGTNGKSDITTPEGRDAGFRAVSGGPEVANGTVLLVEAYAAIWVLLVAFILVTWRRMARLENKLCELDRGLASRGHAAANQPQPGAR